MNTPALTRRDFICQAALVPAGCLVAANSHADPPSHPVTSQPHEPNLPRVGDPLDLKPAQWLWYPANSGWRQWALAAGGRTDEVLRELRELWAPLDSVRLNNTIPEFFDCKTDGTSQWSHAAVAPIYVAVMSLAGIRLLEPAFKRYEIRPQLADLPDLALTVHTPHGSIGFSGKGPLGTRTLTLTLPPNAAGELVVHPDERLALKPLGKGRFALPAGQTVNIELKHT